MRLSTGNNVHEYDGQTGAFVRVFAAGGGLADVHDSRPAVKGPRVTRRAPVRRRACVLRLPGRCGGASFHPMQTRRVEYRDGNEVFEGHVAQLAGEAKRSAVLVFHAWSGESAVERARAEELARQGHVGFAVDLYGRGVRGDLLGDNSHLMNPLAGDRNLLARRIRAAVEAARALPGVDPERIGAIGYCFGGLCALDLARAALPGVRAVVSFHGLLKAPPKPLAKKITAEVLVLHGYDDPLAPPEDVVALGTELSAAGATWELVAYGRTKHAFTFEGAQFPERGLLYDARAARRSWRTALEFLRETLD